MRPIAEVLQPTGPVLGQPRMKGLPRDPEPGVELHLDREHVDYSLLVPLEGIEDGAALEREVAALGFLVDDYEKPAYVADVGFRWVLVEVAP